MSDTNITKTYIKKLKEASKAHRRNGFIDLSDGIDEAITMIIMIARHDFKIDWRELA